MNHAENERAIIMTGYAASEAALEIIGQQWETLIGRYSNNYLQRGRALLEGDVKSGGDCAHTYCESAGRDGVFGALWRLGEQLGTGMTLQLEAIPIRQIAIEMCDLADINPYEAKSSGCMLLAVRNAGEVLEELAAAGKNPTIIGYTCKTNDRVVINGEIRRFLAKSK